ncbi:kinase [Paenibacillus sp. FSL H7-0331]|uniref:kinase n=1 Tax=Paenibacillus sp. FSL H7-0331 TaxID=1920421 RepID=UPI00096E8639|nr:kinase [Paenibacillus sp. FSL H7-0331]OMF09233.1 uridine kinase [Paenibacillus sp. FSL H7-0331]
MEDHITSLFKCIPKLKTGNRFIVGIDGLSRSGKTTLVEKFSRKLTGEHIEVCIFHIDDYIVERSKRYDTGSEEWFEYYYLQWDTEWLKRNLFKKLKETSQLKLPIYDNESDTHRIQNIIIPETCVIVIEGVFLQREEWRGLYDYIAYLDCPRSKRLLRESELTQRNMEKMRNRYWKAEDYYLQTVLPTKQAHLVLNN